MTTKSMLTISTAVAALMFGQSASAQTPSAQTSDGSERDVIIVTATKRAQSILDVPQSIQAIGGEEIADLAISNVEDIISLVPNLNIDEGRKYGGQFNIRGFGAQDATFVTFSTVGLYVDDVPVSDGFANLDASLFDIERIEVLRGPQGTLYGEGSLAGTVRIITNKPALDDFSATVRGGVETTKDGSESYHVGGAVNIPLLKDVAAIRLTGSYDKDGGFLDSAPFPTGAPISEDVNGGESYYVRAALRLKPNDSFTLTPSFTYQRNDAEAGPIDSIALPDLLGYSNGPDTFRDDLYIYALEAEYDFGWATLTSSTSYYDRAFDSIDDDIQANTIISLFIAPSDFTTQTFTRDTETFSQELRLASNGDGPFHWLIGGYYRDKDLAEDVRIGNDIIAFVTGGDERTFLQDNQASFEQIAFFGELSYDLTDQLTVTGGLRWFDEQINSNLNFGVFDLGVFGFVQNPTLTPELSESDVLFKAALTYQPADDLTLYGLFSQGYRPGGVNDRLLDIGGMLTAAQLAAFGVYNQDETTNYEIGLKSRLLDGRVQLNLAGFYIDWDGTQLAAEPLPGSVVVVNANGARTIGAELELVAQLTDRFQFGVGLGYADAEVTSDTTTAAGLVPDGARLPHAPEFSGNVFAEYAHPISDKYTGRLRIDTRFTTERKNRVDVVGTPGTTLDGYNFLNALASFDGPDWSLSIYAKNITNELAELDALLFDEGTIGNTVAGFVRNRPRTIGVQLQKDF